jgi:hypothetical protein
MIDRQSFAQTKGTVVRECAATAVIGSSVVLLGVSRLTS